MDAIAAFLDMGGYAGFVWPAYAVTAVVLAGLVVVSVRTLRHRERGVEELHEERTELGS